MKSVVTLIGMVLTGASLASGQTVTPLPSAPGGITTQPSGGGSSQSGSTPAVGDLDLPLSEGMVQWDSSQFPQPNPPGGGGEEPPITPPPTIYGEVLESESDSIWYVVDVSCSMGWGVLPYVNLEGNSASGPRIDRARVEMQRSISGLSANFEFNIVAYDCSMMQWQPQKQEASDPNKQSAMAWVTTLWPGGATGTGPATSQALGDKDNALVVLLTDGAPNCGASGTNGHRTMISAANSQGATINVFGIAASGSYRAFCQQVAADSGGSYFDVP